MSIQSTNGQLLFNESLASYTTWRVGGVAKQLYKPSGTEDLSHFLQGLDEEESVLWLGLGSNSLIRDGRFDGSVVLTQNCLKNIGYLADNCVRVEAGVSCASMARFCARNNLAGAEFWAGIPGTMGGALRMNAGCFNGETWQSVIEVETIDRAGRIYRRKPSEFTISYRHITGLRDLEWFVAATCQFSPGEKSRSLELIKELLEHRANTQPTSEYNCGSVFRNPPQQFAAQLIEQCGLKGKQIGGAVVSQKHANFIINYQGTASANDIESLINAIKETVYRETNIELIQEVHVLGAQ